MELDQYNCKYQIFHDFLAQLCHSNPNINDNAHIMFNLT